MGSATQIIRRRRLRQQRRDKQQTKRRVGLIFLGILLMVGFILPVSGIVGTVTAVYWTSIRDLPSPDETFFRDPMIGTTQLYDREGQTPLLAAQADEQMGQEWVNLSSLPPYVIQAALIMEDSDFLTTTRFDPLQTFSKLWRNFISGPLPIDTSITGRLVRNVIAPPREYLLTDDVSREIALVAEINRRYTPEEVLEWHLNTNYYGSDAYGIQAAARLYLGKNAVDLTLDEAALLAAVPLAPQYNPLDNELAARGRQSDVLQSMRVAGMIDIDQFETAAATLTSLQIVSRQSAQIAPEFATYARRQAQDILDDLGRDGTRLVSQGGLKITTSLDLDLYYQSECALRIHLARLTGEPTSQTALTGAPCQSAAYLPLVSTGSSTALPDTGIVVIVDARTGEIKSMVGAATAITHQPGPTLYPFVYFTGFINGLFTPATMVLDIPRPFPGGIEGLIYTPTNPDGQFRGPMNLRDAMSVGLLPPAVQIARNEGIDNILRIAHRVGINGLTEEGRYDLSLLERGGEVSVLDMVYAYSVFAAQGEMYGVATDPVGRGYRQRNPIAVLRIEDVEGNVLWDYNDEQIALNKVSVFAPNLGYPVNDILADDQTRRAILGENSISLSRPAAIVNGLTGDRADNWTVGYTPHLAVGVHLDRFDGASMTLDSFGMQGAAAVWRAVIEYAHERDGLPPTEWERPADILETAVCQRSGLLPNGACEVRNEIFYPGTQPTQTDTYWQSVEVNTQTGQLATVNTPSGLKTQRVYFIPPPEAADWWAANNLPLPPTEYDTVSRPELLGSVQILQPQRFAYVGGVVDIRGTLDPTNMQFYQLAYGQGLNPTEWIQIGEQQTDFARGATLGTWNTSNLNGLYNIRLNVVLNDNSVESKIVEVTVDNIPPAVILGAGDPGQIFRWPDDSVIPLVASVEDNLAIERVEFYHNGQLLGVDQEWPYGFEWRITQTGTETFAAVTFDQVGNSASSEIVVTIERGS